MFCEGNLHPCHKKYWSVDFLLCVMSLYFIGISLQQPHKMSKAVYYLLVFVKV
jgi:hypothetical protein